MSRPEKTILPSHFDETLLMMPEVAREFKDIFLPHIKILNKDKVGQIYQNIFNVTESLPEDIVYQHLYHHNYYYVYTDKTFSYQLIEGVAKRYQVFHLMGDSIVPHTKSPSYIIPFSHNVIKVLAENKLKVKNGSTIHRAKSIVNSDDHYKVHRTSKTKFNLEIQLDNMLLFGDNKETLFLPFSLINRLKKALSHWANNEATLDLTVLEDKVSFFINQGEHGSFEYVLSKHLNKHFEPSTFCTTQGIFSIPFKQLWVVAQCQRAKLMALPPSLRPKGFAYDTLALDFIDGTKYQTKIIEGYQQIIYTEDYIKV
jgi:hypothetical protein